MTAILILLTLLAGALVVAPPLAQAPPRGANRPALQSAARAVETALQWPGLAHFLDAAAFTESRWHPGLGASKAGTSNAPIGAWQIRPTSAFPYRGARREWPSRASSIAQGSSLTDPRIAAAAIAAYLYRLRAWNPGATWRDLRAAMAYPIFVQGAPTGEAPKELRESFPTPEAWRARYDRAVDRFDDAIAASGVALDPDAPAAFPAAPAPYVRPLALQIGAIL